MKKLSINSGNIEFEFETARDVEEKFGVAAELWQDYQALVGDKGDDITGADGIGPKTAAILLDRVGSLDEILAQPERCPVSKKQIAKIVKFRSRAPIVRQLVTLRTDLEVGPWMK